MVSLSPTIICNDRRRQRRGLSRRIQLNVPTLHGNLGVRWFVDDLQRIELGGLRLGRSKILGDMKESCV